MNIDKKALIGIITEIEASRERAKAETRHQSEILKQAKEKQFDTKAIRKVLQRRAMSAGDRDSLDLAVDTYERAMGSLAAAQEAVSDGRMTGRQAAEHYGVPRGALAVVTGGSKTGFSSQPPHDADGVITETEESCGGVESRHADNLLNGDALAPIASAVKRIGEQPEAAHSQQTHRAGVAPGPHDAIICAVDDGEPCPNTCALEGRCVWSGKPADEAPATPSVGVVAAEPRVAPPDLEMPDQPPFLRRSAA